ncbi:MAG: hypothetical protein ACRD15_01715 [Vicinamibacterales bacterium]
MAETMDTLAEKITALTTSLDKRFDAVDRRFDEVRAELRMQLEAVDGKVDLVLEKVTELGARDVRHVVVHARLEQRLDDHELRLTALESDRTGPSSPREGGE